MRDTYRLIFFENICKGGTKVSPKITSDVQKWMSWKYGYMPFVEKRSFISREEKEKMRNRREEEEVGEVGEETWQGGRELYLTISHYSYWSDKNRNNETDLKYLNERSDT